MTPKERAVLEDKCPKCGGVLQIHLKEDDDENEILDKQVCRRKYWNKKKKGCGYVKYYNKLLEETK